MTKVRLLVFLLVAGPCSAQFFQGRCCAPGATPAQTDWTQLPPGPYVSGASAPPTQPTGQSISAARLRHKPPRKARAAFLRGIQFVAAGDNKEAAAAFANAIALDPEFSEAHGNLAVEDTWIGRLDDAVREFQRALQLDPATALHHANFSYTLIVLKRFREAEAEAQSAVGLDASDAVAQFLLGCLLGRRAETRSLAEPHLLYAARSVPEAHLALARVYDAQGATQGAAAELQRFQEAAKGGKPARGPRMAFLP